MDETTLEQPWTMGWLQTGIQGQIHHNKVGEAIQELNKLKVKNQKYDEYINTFQMLARQAKITEYNALMLYFLQGLPTKLVESTYNST